MNPHSKPTEMLDDSVVWDADGVPTSIRVFAPGDSIDCYDRHVTYDPTDAQSIMAANTRSDGSVPFDIAHSSTSGATGVDENASRGWGTLRCDATGVWVDSIRWDVDVRSKLKNRGYRFISGTFTVKGDMQDPTKPARLTCLECVALTNYPATVGALPIVRAAKVAIATPAARATKGTAKHVVASVQRAPQHVVASVQRAPQHVVVTGMSTEHKDVKVEASKALDMSTVDFSKLTDEEREECFLRMQAALKAKDAAANEDAADDAEDDDEDEAAEQAKRSLVNKLFVDGLIKLEQRKPLMALRTNDLNDIAVGLRAKVPGKQRSKVTEKAPTDAPEVITATRAKLGGIDPRDYVARALNLKPEQLKELN